MSEIPYRIVIKKWTRAACFGTFVLRNYIEFHINNNKNKGLPMSTRLLSLIVLPLILLAGGCVDVERDSENSSTTAEPAAFEGRAVKGVLQGAVVSAYALENGAQRFLDEAITDATGDFSLKLAVQTAPILLEVTAAGNGSSTMLCDAASGCGSGIGFGDAMPLPTDFRLTALVSPEDLERGTVAITPLTHLAARWARAMPGGATVQAIQVAREQVATLLDIDADFAFQRVPDITDATAMGNADFDLGQHALLAAAFAEKAAQSGQNIEETLNAYADALINNAGQLPDQGEGGLAELLQRARDMADHLGGQGVVGQLRDAFDNLIAGLGGGLSSVPVQGEFDQADFDRAMVALDDLDHYLRMAGIDESGTFLATQAPQVNWLYTEEMLGLVQHTVQTGVAAALVSVLAGTFNVPQIPGLPEQFIDLSDTFGDSQLEYRYYPLSRELVVSGTADGQTLEITIDITPITGNEQQLDYAVDGRISNATAIGELDGTLIVDLNETDLSGVTSALQAMILDPESADAQALLSALTNLLPALHVRGTVKGNGSLVSTEDPSYGFEGRIDAWGELDMPALEDGGPLLALEITSGQLVSPNGDIIKGYRDPEDPLDQTPPALALQVGDSASMQAYFGTQAFGWPEMVFQADGSLDGIGDIASDIASGVEGLSGPDAEGIAGLLGSLDFSVLQLAGTGSITVLDTETLVYEFTLDGNRLDASLPNQSGNALSFYLAGLNGGYIYAGDTLVGTVTFDWQGLGATLYLVNGETRSYRLGPLADIVDPAILQAFLGFFGQLQS